MKNQCMGYRHCGVHCLDVNLTALGVFGPIVVCLFQLRVMCHDRLMP